MLEKEDDCLIWETPIVSVSACSNNLLALQTLTETVPGHASLATLGRLIRERRILTDRRAVPLLKEPPVAPGHVY